MAIKTFERSLKFLVPSWLSQGEGGKALIAVCRILDQNLARGRAALGARFPTRAQDDALAMIGYDRGIPRGRNEISAHYAQRLIAWRYPRGHRVRGSAFALLNQVSEYFGGIYCWTVDKKRNYHERNAEGVEQFSYSLAWTWDADSTHLGRFWIGLFPGALMSAQPSLGDPTLWGGALGTPGYSIGQIGALPGDRDAIRALFTGECPWKPAGTLQQWLVVALDGAIYAPDNTWGNWSKVVAGVRSASRAAQSRYWALLPGINDYAPNCANATALVALPDGTTYGTGNRAAAGTTITLPDGTVYTPVRANAKAKITLVDDGDQP